MVGVQLKIDDETLTFCGCLGLLLFGVRF